MIWITRHFMGVLVLAGLLGALSHACALAANASSSVNISVNIPSSSNLTIGATNLTFVADDPTIQSTVPALENPVSVLARIRTRGTPTLTVLATDDLKDGSNVIPVSAISWSADGSPFVAGTLSRTSAQPAASFPAGPGSYLSSFRFILANSTLYPPGTYATTINYILTAP